MLRANLKLPSLLIICRIAGAVCGVAATLLLTRTLGAEKFGLIAQGMSVAMVLSILCTLSVESGSPRFMITYMAQNRFGAVWSFMRFNMWILVGLSVLVCTGSLFWLSFHNGPASSVYFWAILCAPVIALTRIFAGFGMGFSDVALAVIPRSFLRQFLFLVGAALIVLTAKGVDPFLIIIAFLMANLVVAIAQFILLRPSLQEIRQEASFDLQSMQAWPNWMQIGAIIGSGILFIEFYQFLTILLGARFLTLVEVAQLDICLKLVGFVCFALVAVQQSFTPRNVSAYANNDMLELQQTLTQAASLRLLIGVLGISALALSAPLVLGIFGSEFTAALPVLLISLGIPLAMTIFGPGTNILSLIKRPTILIKIALITVVTLIGAVTLGSILWGVTGAAIGAVTAWCVWGLFSSIFARNLVGVDTSVLSILPLTKKSA
jgi:O-antigen/teichoic acid export membrane protein